MISGKSCWGVRLYEKNPLHISIKFSEDKYKIHRVIQTISKHIYFLVYV